MGKQISTLNAKLRFWMIYQVWKSTFESTMSSYQPGLRRGLLHHELSIAISLLLSSSSSSLEQAHELWVLHQLVLV